VPDADAARLVERLRSPSCYSHPAAAVSVLETHISWVVLAGDFAYKFKKPVRLDFVDFSTPGLRQRYCEEELRLNRRTAPDLYLAVVPVTGTPDAPVVGGSGVAIEHAVKMRRFPQEALLDRVARAGALTVAHVDAFARSVARFHANVARAGGNVAFGSPAEVLAEATGNFTLLEEIDELPDTRAPRQELRAWTGHECARLEETITHRRRDGFVRECHGDLHLGNVALIAAEPVAFDAIEFNEALRWIDVMNEVAFPVMDLVHHGLPRLAHRFLDTYLEATGDYAGLAVLRFYLVYRAMVRAKVSCIRAHQAGVADGVRERSAAAYRGHLDLAGRLARPAAPALVAMHGLAGSGKSSVAQELVEALGAVRLRSDVERKRLHGLEAHARTGSAPGAGLYTAAADRLTYARLAELAGECLAAGYPVVVDATFLSRSWREAFRDIARDRSARFALVGCTAPLELLRARVESRSREGADASEAGLAVLERQLAGVEPLGDDELPDAVLVDTSAGSGLPAGVLESLARRLALEVIRPGAAGAGKMPRERDG
jgi:aminoglycoside phosphotransferase family enzyme/predicted kinase